MALIKFLQVLRWDGPMDDPPKRQPVVWRHDVARFDPVVTTFVRILGHAFITIWSGIQALAEQLPETIRISSSKESKSRYCMGLKIDGPGIVVTAAEIT